MNRLILTTVIVLLFAACSGSKKTTLDEPVSTDSFSVAVDSVNAPVLSFENNSYNFGKVTAGEKVSYEFKFKNSGKSPLIISNAMASCGCTVPDYPHTPVAPGAEGAISVVFNSAGNEGVQDKVITVTANTVPQISQLHLTGEVIQVKTK